MPPSGGCTPTRDRRGLILSLGETAFPFHLGLSPRVRRPLRTPPTAHGGSRPHLGSLAFGRRRSSYRMSSIGVAGCGAGQPHINTRFPIDPGGHGAGSVVDGELACGGMGDALSSARGHEALHRCPEPSGAIAHASLACSCLDRHCRRVPGVPGLCPASRWSVRGSLPPDQAPNDGASR